MNKKILIGVFLLILVIVFGSMFFRRPSSPANIPGQDAAGVTSDSVTPSADDSIDSIEIEAPDQDFDTIDQELNKLQ